MPETRVRTGNRIVGPTPPHGTRRRYLLRADPCRCPDCKAANARYMVAWRANRTAPAAFVERPLWPDGAGP